MDEKLLSPIRLDPKDVLTFSLSPQVAPQTTLTIYNTTENDYLTFKVKTTRPMRYLVRPNQGIIGPDGSATIVVILQQKDCSDLLQLDMDEQQSMNDKFLVQAAIVGTDFATSVAENENPKDVTDALTAKWTTFAKHDMFSKKLKCRFAKTPLVRETTTEDDPGASKHDLPTKKKTVVFQDDDVRESQSPGPSGSHRSKPLDQHGDPIQEVASLRKKYDELVAFTVRLTSQRDSLVTELDKTRSHLKKKSTNDDMDTSTGLRQRRSMGHTGSSSDMNTNSSSVSKTDLPPQHQFKLMHLLLASLIFYLLGRYYG